MTKGELGIGGRKIVESQSGTILMEMTLVD